MKIKLFTIFLVALSIFSVLIFSACKKDRTCDCTLTYFNGDTKTETITAKKVKIKEASGRCASNIVEAETSNGLSGVTCIGRLIK